MSYPVFLETLFGLRHASKSHSGLLACIQPKRASILKANSAAEMYISAEAQQVRCCAPAEMYTAEFC